MESLIQKITSYNIFNYLLPGVLFVFYIEEVTTYSISGSNLFVMFFVYYFLGLVISRIGSIFLDKILVKIRLIKFSSYEKFISACNNNPRLDFLSEQNNVYRSMSALFLIILVIEIFKSFNISLNLTSSNTFLVSSLFLFLLFILSYRKQTSYINKNINK